MICVKNVTVTYGREAHALRNVDLEIRDKGVAILGDDGAGKTTLARLICGQITAKSGDVTLDGVSVKHGDVVARIGYMPQNCPIAPALSVGESLDYVAKLRGLDALAVYDAIELSGLNAGEADLPVGALDAVAKKKAAIALAILGSPEYLVLDQPLSGLDDEGEKVILDILSDLSQNFVFILFTDSVNEAKKFCDLMLVMCQGRAVAFGELGEILSPKVENLEYKARIRGDKEILRSLLGECEFIIRHKASITAGGTVLAELTVPADVDIEEKLAALMKENGCKILDLKKVESIARRVIAQLLEKQAEKEAERREKAEEKAPPIKLTANSYVFRPQRDDEPIDDVDDDMSEDGVASYETDDTDAEETDSVSDGGALSDASIKSILGFHHRADVDDEDGDDSQSTLFSSRDDD